MYDFDLVSGRKSNNWVFESLASKATQLRILPLPLT